ncbi:WD repeat-containing protein 47 isoform X3 [Macrosteles quadrilineatus]|nr:WD repeat-containing protein 47 isoform X3 [Macrosteles quadrilineatus]XP_054277090.1 WD repeat-containing protein 47 isoform X3 [Macrosteles quadrilineatus]
MPSAHLTLREEDVVKLCLEFLHNRDLHISQLSLERETGVINGAFSDDVLFLRQLVLDGQWDDVLEFIQPLEAIPAFDMKRFRFLVLRHKYVELLCIKTEASCSGNTVDSAVEEVVKVLNELERVAPTKEDYSNLCLLLTLPRLTDHLHYKDWNPSNARVKCFRDVFPLVEKFLPGEKKSERGSSLCTTAKNDRLVQLVIKGILYESCVSYCQAKATGSKESQNHEMNFSRLLDGSVGFSDSDLSLLSWLQSIPHDTFSVPFEQRTLNVDVERLERPSLETSWTEHMLVTPIKPKTFPHSAMPFTRPRSAADIMSRSLLPTLEGSPSVNRMNKAALMALSTGDILQDSPMSRSSFASFHLTGHKNNKLMNTSVDRLFDNDGEVFLSSSYTEFQLPSISEQHSTPVAATGTTRSRRDRSGSPADKRAQGGVPSNASTPEHRSSASTSTTARSSRRDSLSDKPISTCTTLIAGDSFDGDLLKEYQKYKQRFNDGSLSREDVKHVDNRLQEESMRPPQNGNGVPVRPAANARPMTNGDAHYDTVKGVPSSVDQQNGSGRPRFVAVTSLEDVQAVRCAEFHPSGTLYAVGSNSKTLRICAYPKLSDLREDHTTYQPTVLFKRTRHHKGSIYCMAWTPVGDLMATGSNDKTVKLMKFNPETSNLEGQEIELTMHDGTVRDVCFLEDTSNKSSLLISGGAGDCKIYITDCATGQPYQALSGHSGHVLTLYNWGGAMFVSGSQDRTVRFWDLRTRGCVNVITPATSPSSRVSDQGSPVAAVCVEPSGRLLVSGHEDSSCVLYDVRGGRTLQCFKPHTSDVRSIRFSPSAYYLLTAGYDNKLVLTDLQGDLTTALPSVVVAQHQDKVISGRWHPTEFSFLSTSADKTATLWALPPV